VHDLRVPPRAERTPSTPRLTALLVDPRRSVNSSWGLRSSPWGLRSSPCSGSVYLMHV
jgi:hypothetical protein